MPKKKVYRDSKSGEFVAKGDANKVPRSTAVERVSTGKGETWRVTRDGKTGEFTSSPKSTQVMDQAVKNYAKALKRLADK